MAARKSHMDQRVMKALSHPLRVRMLTLLNQKVASPSELATELGEPLGNVSYHMRFLADLDLVRLVRTEPRRGAVEHYYEALEPPRMSGDDWERLPASLRGALADSRLSDIAREVETAVGNGGFDREDAHISRTSLLLDDQAWAELSALLADVVERARALQEESAERSGNERRGIPTALALMQFETARRGARAAGLRA
jgi:DNA-binding transcriptional ArsR family regulator